MTDARSSLQEFRPRTRVLRIFASRGRWYSALVFEPRDLWVGVYWTCEDGKLLLYICPLPTLVWKVVRA